VGSTIPAIALEWYARMRPPLAPSRPRSRYLKKGRRPGEKGVVLTKDLSSRMASCGSGREDSEAGPGKALLSIWGLLADSPANALQTRCDRKSRPSTRRSVRGRSQLSRARALPDG